MNELKSRVFSVNEVFYSDDLKVLRSRPCYEFLEGVKTENRVATYVQVVDLESYDKYEIRMPLGNEVLEQKIIKVDDLINFTGTLYVRNRQVFWSLKADGIGV